MLLEDLARRARRGTGGGASAGWALQPRRRDCRSRPMAGCEYGHCGVGARWRIWWKTHLKMTGRAGGSARWRDASDRAAAWRTVACCRRMSAFWRGLPRATAARTRGTGPRARGRGSDITLRSMRGTCNIFAAASAWPDAHRNQLSSAPAARQRFTPHLGWFCRAGHAGHTRARSHNIVLRDNLRAFACWPMATTSFHRRDKVTARFAQFAGRLVPFFRHGPNHEPSEAAIDPKSVASSVRRKHNKVGGPPVITDKVGFKGRISRANPSRTEVAG